MGPTGDKPISLYELLCQLSDIEDIVRKEVHKLQQLSSQVLWKMQEEEDETD